jgi:hypothetical protein
MAAVAFDTLKVARALRTEAMMSSEQAEGLANVLAEAMSGAELATRSDVAAARAEAKNDTATLRAELAALKAEMKADFKDAMAAIELAKRDLTIKLGAMMAASIAVVATLVKLIH